jgi:hypothetical protein
LAVLEDVLSDDCDDDHLVIQSGEHVGHRNARVTGRQVSAEGSLEKVRQGEIEGTDDVIDCAASKVVNENPTVTKLADTKAGCPIRMGRTLRDPPADTGMSDTFETIEKPLRRVHAGVADGDSTARSIAD